MIPQIAVGLSLATEQASLPVAWRLYLPASWTDDPARCRRAGVPEEIDFATKPEIALQQVRETLEAGMTPGIVLADAAYGKVTSWREQLAQWGLSYCVDVPEGISLWPPGSEPVPPQWSGQGRPPTRWQQTAAHHPVPAQALAESLNASDYQTITWREGTHKPLCSRFAAVRVRVARGQQKREPEWLLIEWPQSDAAPAKYWSSNLSEDTPLTTLVATAKGRWRIERDYQELKQAFGLKHYEGRNGRGFHHHATLCTVAYGFLVMERLRCGDQKNISPCQAFAVPESDGARRHETRTTPRGSLHRDSAVGATSGDHGGVE